MSGIATKLITAEELLKMGDIGRCELIYGELVMISPAGFCHGEIALRIGHLLASFVEERDLGVVLAAETGYVIERDPDLVRAPDASFVRKQRVPKTTWKKYFPGVPDLAVEVISPDDTKREVAEKVNMWLAHGTISCWVADPESQTVSIHRAGQEPIRLGIRDKITGEPALPRFVLAVSRIFKRP
jgi:Uma2 family endonuclease